MWIVLSLVLSLLFLELAAVISPNVPSRCGDEELLYQEQCEIDLSNMPCEGRYFKGDCDNDGIVDHACIDDADGSYQFVLSTELSTDDCPKTWGPTDRSPKDCQCAFIRSGPRMRAQMHGQLVRKSDGGPADMLPPSEIQSLQREVGVTFNRVSLVDQTDGGEFQEIEIKISPNYENEDEMVITLQNVVDVINRALESNGLEFKPTTSLVAYQSIRPIDFVKTAHGGSSNVPLVYALGTEAIPAPDVINNTASFLSVNGGALPRQARWVNDRWIDDYTCICHHINLVSKWNAYAKQYLGEVAAFSEKYCVLKCYETGSCTETRAASHLANALNSSMPHIEKWHGYPWHNTQDFVVDDLIPENAEESARRYKIEIAHTFEPGNHVNGGEEFWLAPNWAAIADPMHMQIAQNGFVYTTIWIRGHYSNFQFDREQIYNNPDMLTFSLDQCVQLGLMQEYPVPNWEKPVPEDYILKYNLDPVRNRYWSNQCRSNMVCSDYSNNLHIVVIIAIDRMTKPEYEYNPMLTVCTTFEWQCTDVRLKALSPCIEDLKMLPLAPDAFTRKNAQFGSEVPANVIIKGSGVCQCGGVLARYESLTLVECDELADSSDAIQFNHNYETGQCIIWDSEAVSNDHLFPGLDCTNGKGPYNGPGVERETCYGEAEYHKQIEIVVLAGDTYALTVVAKHLSKHFGQSYVPLHPRLMDNEYRIVKADYLHNYDKMPHYYQVGEEYFVETVHIKGNVIYPTNLQGVMVPEGITIVFDFLEKVDPVHSCDKDSYQRIRLCKQCDSSEDKPTTCSQKCEMMDCNGLHYMPKDITSCWVHSYLEHVTPLRKQYYPDACPTVTIRDTPDVDIFLKSIRNLQGEPEDNIWSARLDVHFWGTSIVDHGTEIQLTVNPGRLDEVVTHLCKTMYLISQNLDFEEVWVDGVCECGCPTLEPSTGPSQSPTVGPSQLPSVRPSETPTSGPSQTPTFGPTPSPTFRPTSSPSLKPTTAPTFKPTDSPTNKPTDFPLEEETLPDDVCFTADDQVQKENGKLVSIGDLKIGDRIATGFEYGSYSYHQVSFLKFKREGAAIKLITESSWVGLASNHYINTQNGTQLARDVQVGDKIRALENWERVVKIERYFQQFVSVRTTDPGQEVLVNGLYVLENSKGDEMWHRQAYNFIMFKWLLRNESFARFGHKHECLGNLLILGGFLLAIIFAVRHVFPGKDRREKVH